jgi:hypothetical protein
MSALLQQIIVILLVSAATLFAVWRLPGEATRLRWLVFLERHCQGSRRLTARVQRQILLRRSAIGGSGCGSCGSNAEQEEKRP